MNGKELDLSKIADMISKTAENARDKLENQSDKMYNIGEDMMSSVGDGALSGAKSAAKNIEAAGDIITAKYQKVLDEINKSGKKKGDIASLFATMTQIKRSDLNSFNALKDELKDIKAIFSDVGEVKGLDAILRQYGKTADKLKSIDFGFGSAFVARGRIAGTKNIKPEIEDVKVSAVVSEKKQQVEINEKLAASEQKVADTVNEASIDVEKRLNKAIQNQKDWLRYLDAALSDDNFVSTGKKDATNKLRARTQALIQQRKNPDKSKQYADEMVEVAWKKAYDEAKRQGVADSTLTRYQTDAGTNYERNLNALQKEREYRADILAKTEAELATIQRTTTAINAENAELSKQQKIVNSSQDIKKFQDEWDKVAKNHAPEDMGQRYGYLMEAISGDSPTMSAVDALNELITKEQEWKAEQEAALEASKRRAEEFKTFILNATEYQEAISSSEALTVEYARILQSISDGSMSATEGMDALKAAIEKYNTEIGEAVPSTQQQSEAEQAGIKAATEAAEAHRDAANAMEQEAAAAEKLASTQYDKTLNKKDMSSILEESGANSLLSIIPKSHQKGIRQDLANFVNASFNDDSQTAMDIYNKVCEVLEKYGAGKQTNEKYYAQIWDYLKGITITIPEDMEQSFAAEFQDEWKQIRKKYGGNSKFKIAVGKGGTGVDQLYEELKGVFPGAFSDEHVNIADQLRTILNAAAKGKIESKLPATSVIPLSKEDWGFITQVFATIEEKAHSLQALYNNVNNSASDLAESSERTANSMERQVGASREVSSNLNDSVEEENTIFPIGEGLNDKKALGVVSTSKKPTLSATAFDGITNNDQLQTAFQSIIKDIEQQSMTLVRSDILDSIDRNGSGTLKFVSDDMNNILVQTWKMIDGQLTLASEKYTSIFKESELFDVEDRKKVAQAQAQTLRTQFKGFANDPNYSGIISGVETAADDIFDAASFKKFQTELAAAKEALKQLKTEMSSSGSLDPLAAAEKKLNNLPFKIEKIKTEYKSLKEFDTKDIVGAEGVDVESLMKSLQSGMDGFNDSTKSVSERLSSFKDIIKTFGQLESLMSALRAKSTDSNKSFTPILKAYKELLKLQEEQKKAEVSGATDEKKGLISDNIKTKIEQLKQLGIDIEDINKNTNLTTEQRNKLLKEQEESLARIKQIEVDAANSQAQKEKRQSLNYGKGVFNSETKKKDNLSTIYSSINENSGASAGLTAAMDAYIAKYNEFEKARQKIADPTTDVTKADRDAFNKAKLEVENARKAVEEYTKSYSKLEQAQNDGTLLGMDDTADPAKLQNSVAALKEYGAEISNGKLHVTGFNKTATEMYGTIDRGKGVIDQVTVALESSTGTLYAYKTATKEVGTVWEQFKGSLSRKSKELTSYIIGGGSIYGAINQVRKGISYVKEIDSALTELKKVTDETDETYKQFLKTMSATGAEIGATVSNLTNMAASWARLGYSIKEAGDLAKSTAVLLNVSEFTDADTASEALISTMQAYGYAAEDSMHVVDVLNEVGNNFAVSSDGLATALQDSASSLMAAGNNLEQSVAMVAAANKVLQDPSSVGAALRTISLRIRGTSTKILEEMGEETDGVIESVSKLQAKVKGLSGVDILTDTGAYKDTYTIIKEIAEVWDQMSDIDQAALLELLAGKNRSNAMAALIGNLDDLEGAYETAMDAQGSAEAENEKYLNSIQGKVDQFTNALQTMWTNWVDSSVIKFVVDLGTGLVQLADKIGIVGTAIAALGAKLAFTKGFSELKNTINDVKTAFSTAMNTARGVVSTISSFSGEGLASFLGGKIETSSISAITQAINAEIAAQGTLNKELARQILINNGVQAENIEGALAAMGYTSANGALTFSFKALGTSIVQAGKAFWASPFGKFAIIAAGIALVAKLIDALITTHGEYVDKLKETSDEISDVRSDIKSLNNELKTTQERIDELNSKDKLSFTEKEELKNLKAQNAELERSIRLKEQKEKRLQKKAARQLNDAVISDPALTGKATVYKDANGRYVSYNDAHGNGTGTTAGGYGLKSGYSSEQVSSFQAQIIEYERVQKELHDAEDELENLGDDATDKEINAAEEKVKNLEKQSQSAYDTMTETMDNFDEYLSQEGVEWQYGDPDELEDWQKQMNANLKIIYDAQDRMAIASDTTGKAIESAFSRVSSQTEFEDELKSIQETAGITGEKLKEMYDSSTDMSDTGLRAFIQSLIDCGVIADTSAEELQKVVDLAVELGDNTSEAAVANQKLARSQKRLQYYKQYKELNGYVNSLKKAGKNASNLTDEQKKLISSMSQNLQALAKEIDAYDILGAQIEEAKQAFEDFEKAKESDKNTDYASTAGEMLQTVIEGFQSAEMGTEAFKSAFTGLIPDSVYKDLDTLEEKYTAAAQYISEDLSKYFTIKYDDEGVLESVEVTTKNIETFMEEAQSKGLATFENGQWTILETNFKKFASDLGITTSALVAFGEQADKLDSDWIMGDYSSFFDIFDMDTESNIDKITRSLANLDLQLLNGQIDVNDYAQEYAKLQNELASEKANAVSDIVEYDNTTKEIDSLKTQLQEATNKLNELKTSGASEDQITNAANEAGEIAKNLQEAIKKKSDLCQPSEMLVEVALEDIQATKDRITAELGTIDANLQLTTTDKDGNEQINSSIIKQLDDGTYTINVDANLSDEAKAKVQEYVDALNSEVQINQYVTGTQDATTDAENLKQTYNDLSEVIENLPDVSISTVAAQAAVNILKTRVDKLKTAIEDLPKDVTITTTNVNRTVTAGAGGGGISGAFSLNGNAHFDGVANASGTLGAEKTETSLVGELGPELRVRGNRWKLLGENGAEFADVKKGDIIFNHKQTEQLMKNGYVNGRGKAFASGNAHTTGTIFTKYATVSGYGGTVPDWFGHSSILGDIAGSVSDASDSVEAAADDAKQTIDFIEYRLEEIENSITNMTNRVENFLDDTSQTKEKNNLYEGLVDAEKQKASTYLAAAEAYNKKAAQLLSEVPSQYQEMAKNGAIAIKNFIGENEGKIADAIEEYRTWSTKAEDAENSYLESIAEISAKRLEQLQDIADDFENIVGLTERHSSLIQAEMDLLDEAGERLSENFYKELMKDSQKQIADLNNKRASLQDILDQAVKSGDVRVGTDDWYEMVNAIYDVDDSILSCKKDIEGFQNSINDLYWDNLDKLIDKIDNVDSELSHLYNLVSDEEKVVDEFGNWTKDGVTALGLLAQQLEAANFKVDQYGEAIARLEKDYAAGLYSTDEYNEKLAELKENQWDAIEAQEAAKKSIIDLNKTRIESVKTSIQAEIDSLSRLIDKKKEELQLQKDTNDFAKQVAEKQKNIADIQKRLAVISGDNSASAIAQKKKLQAELKQAQDELNDLYYDHSIEKQQEALDKSLENYQDNKQDEMDALDESLKNENQVIQDSYAVIAANTDSLVQNLSEIADKYGITLSDSVTKPWLEGVDAIGTYQEQLDTSASAFTEQLRALKQELVDLQVEADNTADSIIKATNSKKNSTESAKYTPPTPSTPQQSPATEPATPAAPTKGSSVTLKKSATHFSRDGGNGTRMQSWVPGSTFTVYQVSGSEVLIGRNGGYTGWVKLSDIEGYASGAKSINKDQFAFLDELGEELQLVPDGAGRLSYLRKGTGIIPADLTERLMEWGQLDPSSVLEQSRPTVSTPHVINNNIELNMQIGEVVHIDRADNSSIPNITKAVQDQMDNYMKNINKKLYNRVR